MNIQKAINLIDEQSEQTNNPGIKRIATYILDNLLTSEENALKILKDEKSLKDCWSKIVEKARKQSSGNSAFIEDEVVFSWVREYYGITLVQSNAQIQTEQTSRAVSLLDLI